MRNLLLAVLLSATPVLAQSVCELEMAPPQDRLQVSSDLAAMARHLSALQIGSLHKLIVDGTSGSFGPFETRAYEAVATVPFAIERRRPEIVNPYDSAHPYLRVVPVQTGDLRMDLVIQPERRYFETSQDENIPFWDRHEAQRARLSQLRENMLNGDLLAFRKPHTYCRLNLTFNLPEEAVGFTKRSRHSHHLRVSTEEEHRVLRALGAFEALSRVRREFGSSGIGLKASIRGTSYNGKTMTLQWIPELEVPERFDKMNVSIAFYRHMYDVVRERHPQLVGEESAPRPSAASIRGFLNQWLAERSYRASKGQAAPQRDTQATFAAESPLGRITIEGYEQYIPPNSF